MEAVTTADESFCFDFEHTFLGTCAPSVIDTSLLPDMVLVIQLHGNEVLSSVSGVSMAEFIVDGTQVPTYALSHIRFTCEALALGSGVYDQLVARKLADSGVLELPLFLSYRSNIRPLSIRTLVRVAFTLVVSHSIAFGLASDRLGMTARELQ